MTGSLIAAAAATGLVGGLHCAAMCGPLAVGGCAREGRVSTRRGAGYLGGRLVAYSTVGALLGGAGHELAHAASIASLQGVALAAVALAAAWRGLRLLLPARPVPLARRRRAPVWHWAAAVVPRHGLGLGLATALLPCGMLMAAWMLAASAGAPLGGAGVMAVFALASTPGLLAPLLARRLAEGRAWRCPPRLAGVAWCALALWLALRPLIDVAHAM